MRDRNQHLHLYRIEGTKPNGRKKVHVKCSRNQAEAMAYSWRRGKPDVVTHTGEKIDLEPLKDVKVTKSNPVTWPEQVPSFRALALLRAADTLQDQMAWNDDPDDDYQKGYADAIAALIALAEEARRDAGEGDSSGPKDGELG